MFFSIIFQSCQDDSCDYEHLYAMEPGLQLKRSVPQVGLKPWTARSEGIEDI